MAAKPAGLATKFPPYERVVLRDPAFVRPVVLFGAIADVARDKLLSDFPERFESPQTDKGSENDPKKGKTGIIRFGAIREAINHQKHCVLDVTPYHVDRLNYAQYYPIVVFLRGENKQAIKEVRSRWRAVGNSNKNPKKLHEHNERMDNLYSHLFTGTIMHSATDIWFPKLVEMIQSQQRRPVWMSEKKPEEDFNDDLMFPMPNRLSMAGAPESELDLARPSDDLDTSPMQKKRLVRSSSDPSINTGDRVPGIPPYPAPPGYQRDSKMVPYSRDEWDDYRHPISARDGDGDWQMHPDDRYYPHPHHNPDSWAHSHPPPLHQPYAQRSRSSIDVYATITPSERVRKRVPDSDYPGGYDDFDPHREQMAPDDPYYRSGPRSPHDAHMPPQGGAGDQRGYNDASSNDNDSYSRYVNSAANKHDDSKLRDKFGALQVGAGRERNPASHDPYRFTRSTANPVSSANIDRAKLSHLTARYRREDGGPGKPGSSKSGGPTSPSGPGAMPDSSRAPQKKKEPPPVPAKTYSLKEVGMDVEEVKARNYENSNRSYNYSDIHYPGQQQPPSSPEGGDPHYQHDPHLPPPLPPQHTAADSPYEYISARNLINSRPQRSGRGDNPPELPPPPRDDYDYDPSQTSRAFSNSVYMDHRDVDRARSGPGDPEAESMRLDQAGYTRPRTDDEQLRDLQYQRHRTRVKSDSRLADRAKSETRLDDCSAARWNKYRSWDREKEGQRTFDSYKKLITPGFYGSKKSMSKSHDELREEVGPDTGARTHRGLPSEGEGRGSAFESYRKTATSTSLPPGGRPRSQALEDNAFTSHGNRHLKDSLPPPPPPPPPPPLSPHAAPFTEMSIAPNKPLPPPPPTQPLAAILTAFPTHKARASSGPKTTVGSLDRGSVAERQNSAEEGKTNHDSDKSLVNGFRGRSSQVGSSSAKTSVERQVSQDHPEDGKSKVDAHVGKSGGPAQKKTGSGSSVSEKIRKLQSSLPPPPPLPSDSRPAKTPARKSSSAELPLPPPPPLSMTDAQKLKSSPPPRPPPPKTMPLPPPPPPLVVTPLPLVDVGKNEEAKTNGKIPLKSLSGATGGVKEEEAHGEESGDGEMSESVSTPDTVIANGPGREMEDGQTIVATARGVFTSAGGVLESKETGVSIVIPEGALDEGTSQEIYFKVCSGNSILPPLDEDKGETLLSPLVMCGPHGLRFNKPVELRLPHSASVNPESWSFALKSSDSPSGQPTQWQNMTLAGSEGVAQGRVNQNSVSVLVDHF